MKGEFYELTPKNEKGGVKIQLKTKYSSIKMIDEYSPIIKVGKFSIASGTNFFDLIQFRYSFFFAISKRFKDILVENNFKGFEISQIKIDGTDAEYFVLFNLHIAGPILNLEAVNNYTSSQTEFSFSTLVGNADMFTLKDTLLHLCNQRLKEKIEKAQLSNVNFENGYVAI